jgi:hypothetical protein
VIFEDVEVLDFCGPFEVFTVASRFTDPAAFNVLTLSEKPGPVVTRGGPSVNSHHRLADCPRPDPRHSLAAGVKDGNGPDP